MAHSYTRHNYEPGRTDYDLSFSGGYRARNDVSVVRLPNETSLVDAPVQFSFLDTYRIRISEDNLVKGDVIEIRRTVDKILPPVDLNQPGNLTREAVDAVTEHTMYVCQELLDGRIDDWSMLDGFAERLDATISIARASALEAVEAAEAAAQSAEDAETGITNGINSAVSIIRGGVSTTYDTLAKVATKFGTVDAALGNRLRIDAAQTLTASQKAFVEGNLDLGDTTTDFVASYVTAKA